MRTNALVISLLLGVGCGLAVGVLHAQDEPAAAAPPGFLEAPEVIPSPITGEAVEPEITIVEEGDQVVYEYRARGRLYMVRVQPQIGPPYFLLDTDGDGVLDMQEHSPRNISIPQWVLFRWD
ncbi:MAG: DUF2782 domain-containing protein [Sphingobacteriia bacterium]|nr:DUF2782 domain-containing protein [Sphingobacteriia bacterium]NCC40030.1 DUF2782 domain-containing protein [Gammaproteobacteria bacterium]